MKNKVLKITAALLFLLPHAGLDNNRFPVMLFLFYICSFVFFATTWSGMKEDWSRNSRTCFIVSGIVLSLFLRYVSGNIYGTYRLYTMAVLWILFLSFYAAQSLPGKNRRFLAWVVIATVAVETVLGIAQSIGLLENSDPQFIIGGSMTNPGAYAGYLGVTTPLILSLLVSYKKNKRFENICYILGGLFILVCYLLILSRSRGAWIACGAGCLCVLCYRYARFLRGTNYWSKKAIRTPTIILSAVLIIASGFFVFKMKEDSALGRILVWKVTLSTPHPHASLLWGNGIGYFESQYGKWQADYFREKEGTEKERHIAGYVTTAYNEFLELGLEQGIIVTACIAALLVMATGTGWKNLSTIELGAKASIVSITILMFCSYPLKVLPTTLYLMFCLSVALYGKKRLLSTGHRMISNGVRSLAGPLICVFALAGMINAYGYYFCHRGQQRVMRHDLKGGIEMYKKAQGILRKDGIFHFYLGSAYFLSAEYQKAIEELSVSCTQCSNPSSFILLGNAYRENRDTAKAIDAYTTAVYIQPSKLYPKYLLAKLYEAAGDYGSAGEWASKILATDEKVPTTAAKEIKEEMRLLLKQVVIKTKKDDYK